MYAKFKSLYHLFRNLFFNGNKGLIWNILFRKNDNVLKISNLGGGVKQCRFKFIGRNCRIEIEKGCNLTGLSILMGGDGSKVIIKSGCVINATKYNPVIMNAFEGKCILIEENCLFSNNIQLHTTDYHPIYPIGSDKRLNEAKDIVVGAHTWVGLNTLILKGTKIPGNSIVGAGSLLSGIYEDENSVIAGLPAHTLKTGVRWEHNLR